MTVPSVVIVDYGVGNLFSVAAAMKKVGVPYPKISGDEAVVERADRLILPGVGAFGDAMQRLRESGLIYAVKRYAASGKPMMGVCLGMQLLMSESEEFGFNEGLDLIPGRVTRLNTRGDPNLRIPLIGWNPLHFPDGRTGNRDSWDHSFLRHVQEGAFMYFLHSYVVVPGNPDAQLAVAPFGSEAFCCAVQQDNIGGVQFHPERSGEEGLEIYRSFVFDH